MASEIQKAQSTTTIFLDQPPSCLQFCPESPNFFVVGTYLLSENKDEEDNIQQTKTGSLQLWQIDPVEDKLTLIQRIPLPYAVFDLHFHPRDPTILAIASSTGSIALFRVSSTQGTVSPPELTHLWTLPVHEDSSTPALFLAWAPKNWCPRNPATDAFAVTFSDGRTTVFGANGKGGQSSILEESEIVELGRFDARQAIEVWFVTLDAVRDDSQSGVEIPFMFTGNDFGSLHTRRFNVEGLDQGDDDDGDEGEQNTLSPLLLDHDDRARHHTAGVTSILSLPLPLVDGAPLLLTGSYDEYLRVYHATQRGQVLAEECLGGGVWRLQILNVEHSDNDWSFLVLASCMHAGTRMVRVTRQGEEWNIQILAEFTEHQSMNYASDVWKGQKAQDASSEQLCVSSSFYDKRVCIWRANA